MAVLRCRYRGTAEDLHAALRGEPWPIPLGDRRLEEILPQVHRELCAEEIRSTVQEAMRLGSSGDRAGAVLVLASLEASYPWSDIVHGEYAIALDEAGQPGSALRHITSAIATRP